MFLIEEFIISIILVLFPIFMYMFYVINRENLNLEKNNNWFDFSLLSSLYLSSTTPFYIFNFIILYIAYNKKRDQAIILLSILIMILYNDLILNFILIAFFLMYKLSNKIFSKAYIFLVPIIIILYSNSFVHFLVHGLIFIIVFLIINYVFTIIESIIKLHYNVKEIVKEQRYHTTLFKITHEIKNPIAVCKTYLDMFDINKKEHFRYIGILKEEMDKILLLLQDFLSLNSIKINKEIIDITMLIEDIINQFNPIIATDSTTFNYEIIDDEIYIEGDYNRLNQVLVNVIKNAIESKEEDLNIKIQTFKDKSNYTIMIKDNGCGFDMEDMDKIKEPFYTTKTNGTGLGVALSYEIIKAHNGTINYDSAIKKGTIVTIKLPIVHLEG